MGSRAMPQECEHGRVMTWGSFGPEDGTHPPSCLGCDPPLCPECDAERQVGHDRLETVFYAEVMTCAGHHQHGRTCNCRHTVGSLLQRMRLDPGMVYDWLVVERDQSS